MIKGTGVSKGIALAKQYLIDSAPSVRRETVTEHTKELEALRASRALAVEQLTDTGKDAATHFGAAEQEVFEAQLLLLDSDDLWNCAERGVLEKNQCAEWAFDEVIEERITMFSQLESAYLQERVLDLKDIRQRVLRCLSQKPGGGSSTESSVILIGSEVMPSQLMDHRYGPIRGIAMEAGGITSHTVLLANMMGIPCVVGACGLLAQAVSGDEMILNGSTGEIFPHPGAAEKAAYEESRSRLAQETELDRAYIGRPDRAKDGTEVLLWCNIASVQDTKQVRLNDSSGVGLMRSEFLFLGRQGAPDEAEQYAAYRQMARDLVGKPLVIRTLDIGADKQVSYLDLGEEDNPALGFRAIRYCLKHEEIFLPQVRAILRAGTEGDVRMMFPMIASLSELRMAKTIVARAKEELRAEGLPFRDDMPVGVMIEVPSAALMAEDFAAEADFFSVGTNDLTQYVLSADRTNANVSQLNQPYAPALLRLMGYVAQKACSAGTPIAICGHAGQDPLLLPVWLAMGISELSVSPTSVLELRRTLSGLTRADCTPLLERVLQMQTTEEVLACLREFHSDRFAGKG